MDVTQLTKEGYRPIIDTEPQGVSEKTAHVIGMLKARGEEKREAVARFEATIQRLIYDPEATEEEVKVDELAKQNLIETRGFDGHPPESFAPGTEPLFAPMSREQMQTLLLKILPIDLVPFAMERLAFDFEHTDENQPDRGPTISVHESGGKQKVHLHLTKDHFISQGVAENVVTEKEVRRYKLFGLTDRVAREMAKKRAAKKLRTIAYVDPSKVSMYIGKLIAKLIPQPEKWPEQIDKNFDVTINKKKGQNRRVRFPFIASQRTPERLQKQWEDFVALALTAPELAQRNSPEAYEFFQKYVKNFNDNPALDKEAIRRVQDEILIHGGKLEIPHIEKMKDLRTEQERQANSGETVRLPWYERWIAGVNKATHTIRHTPGLSLLGKVPILNNLVNMKIIYSVPEDLMRADQLANAEPKVKEIMSLSEKELNEDFGLALAGAEDFSEKGRANTFNYLLAASQGGKLEEWRIYAWLYKFSKEFRNSGGNNISERDYKDLELVYSQSEKADRIGSGVMPYEAVRLDIPDAQHYGRRRYTYVRKERAAYIREVESKIRNKSQAALSQAEERTEVLTKRMKYGSGDNDYFGINESFDPASPSGQRVKGGTLEDYLGKELGPQVAGWLQQLGIDKIPPDARAMAIAYYDHYLKNGRQSDRFVSDNAIKTIEHYGGQLTAPPEERVKAILAIPAKRLAESGNFEKIASQMADIEAVQKDMRNLLGAELSETRFAEILPSMVREEILNQLELGQLDSHSMLNALEPYFQVWYPLHDNNASEREDKLATLRRNVIRFMTDPKVERTINLVKSVGSYEVELHPPYTYRIIEAAKSLANEKPEELIKANVLPKAITHAELESYTKQGIKLDAADLDEIKKAGTDINTDKSEDNRSAVNLGADEGVDLKADDSLESDAEPKKEARAQIVARKVAKADQATREQFVAKALEGGTARLKEALFFPSIYEKGEKIPLNSTYETRFKIWLDSPAAKIFRAPGLSPILGEFSLAISRTNRPDQEAQAIEDMSRLIDDIARAVNFETNRQALVKKQAEKAPKDEDEKKAA